MFEQVNLTKCRC